MISECPSCRYPIGDLEPAAGDRTVDESDRTEERTIVRCPNCGALCESDDSVALSVTAELPANSRNFAHFRLREILGRGGFGTVWLADDLRLERRVALKLPRQTEGNLGNLLREAKTVAKLRHPNIVSVHEVGEVGGQVFIVCEYIEGMDLHSLLCKGAIRESRVIDLLQAISAGLHHAHENQVVHRDVKPGNVLIDEAGTPLVTDFGLAKNIDIEESISSKGKIVGTLIYMAPEQAGAELDQVDRRADIYALGVMMFEMLTGERPFRGDLPAIMRQKESDEPPPSVRELRPSIALDLDTICRKCLQRNPERRYETAAEFADELERYRKGLPIQARPVSNLEYAWRWCLRNRAVASLLMLLFLSLGFGLAGTTHYSLRASEQTEQVKRSLYASQMLLASQYLSVGDTEATRESLARFRSSDLQYFRGFEWHFVDRTLRRFAASVQQGKRIEDVAISRDGDWFATVAVGRMLGVWDSKSGQLLREIPSRVGRWQCVAVSLRDNQLVAGAKDGTVYAWASIQDNAAQPRVINHGPGVTVIRFSTDGRRLFTAGVRGAVRVWDASTLERVAEIPTGQTGLVDFDVSQDGAVLVTVGSGGLIRAWEVDTRTRLCELDTGREVESIAVSSDGTQFVAGSKRGRLLGYHSDGSESFEQETMYGWISDLAFLDSSPIIAICSSGGAIAFFDCDIRRELRYIETHTKADGVFSVSAKARFMAVGSVAGAAQVLDISDFRGTDMVTLDQVVREVCFLADEQLIAALENGSVARVELSTQKVQTLSEADGQTARAIAASQHAARIAVADRDGSVRLFDAAGTQIASIPSSGFEAVVLRFNAVGDKLVIATDSGKITAFDIGTSHNPIISENFSLQCEAGVSIRDLCLSSGGERIAVAMDKTLTSHSGLTTDRDPASETRPVAGKKPTPRNGQVRFVDVASESWEETSLSFESRPVSVAFAGDDLIVGTRNGFLSRFEGMSLHPVWRTKAHSSRLNRISVIPGGDAVATVGGDRGWHIWDLTSGDLRFCLYRHDYQIFGVDSSSDGKTLVTGGLGGDVRIWRASPNR